MIDQHQMVDRRVRGPDRGLSHIISGADHATLAHILRPGINLAIWRRNTPFAMTAWLSACSAEDLIAAQDVELRCPAVCVPALLAAKIPAPSPERRAGILALAHDAGALAILMAKLARAPCVRVRVEWVRDQPCSYFHTDKVSFRLVCTYHGPATEWLSNDVAGQLQGPQSIPPESEVRRMATGDVAVMRGSLHSKDSEVPLTHRSPPLDFPLEWRLFLAVDSVDSRQHEHRARHRTLLSDTW